MDQAYEDYILKHIDEEPELLKRLYRDVHVNLLRPRMVSGHLQGRFLKMICRMINPKNILELGTFAGYSALSLIEGCNDEATLHTIEINDELEDMITRYFEQSEYGERIHLHIGNAMDIVPQFQDEMFDLVFIDADKRLYSDFYHLTLPKLRKGGIILADNTLWSGKVMETPAANDAQTIGVLEFNDMVAHDDRVEKVILPMRDGLSLIRKK